MRSPAEADGPGAGDPQITLTWLLRLRWGLVAGELAVLFVAAGPLAIPVTTGPLLGLLAAMAASNVLLIVLRRRGVLPATRAMVGTVLAADVALLTALLSLSGGASNPFSALYLVHVTLAAVTLTAPWTWALVALSCVGYGLLFALDNPLASQHQHHGGGIALHLQGMWLAFAIAAALVAVFVGRVATALRQRDLELGLAHDRAARSERVAALTTLAAGAAHELATPIGTIAVVARELERQSPGDAEVTADLRLILSEVERCRGILDGMAASSGGSRAARPERLDPAAVIHAANEALPAALLPRVQVLASPGPSVVAPREPLTRAVGALLDNALRASPGGPVRVEVTADDAWVAITVEDTGAGMSPEAVERAGEPFFTTREPGAGMGLGLFLARATAEQLGGSLHVESALGRGTRATLRLPRGDRR